MAPTNHVLEIYEPYEYDGQNPVSAEGVAVVQGPGGNRYYLISLPIPFNVGGDKVEQLLLQCRYTEDRIERPTQSMTTVNIACVRPGLSLDESSDFTFADIIPWGVGKIAPSKH